VFTAGVEDLVYTAQQLYIRPMSATTPPAKPWESSSVLESGDTAGTAQQLIFQAEALDPGIILAELVAGATSAAPAGTASVNGVAITRYIVIVDLSRSASATGAAPTAYGEVMATEAKSLTDAGGQPSLSVVVELDGHGSLAGLVLQPPGAEVGTLTLRFRDAGTSVTVTEPPADQTVPLNPSSGSSTGVENSSSSEHAG